MRLSVVLLSLSFRAGAFHPHASRVFRSQFGGFPGTGYAQQQRQQRAPSREEQQRAQLMGLFQVGTAAAGVTGVVTPSFRCCLLPKRQEGVG